MPESVRKIRDFQKKNGAIGRVVLVDDGSRDGTASLVRSLAAGDESIRAISYWPNAGKGYAIRRGVLEALPADAVLITDADLSTPIEDLARLEAALQDADVAIGSRALALSSIGVRQAWYRQWMGRSFNRLMRAITGIPFNDTQCGFKLFRGEAAARIFEQATVDRFAYDVEVLLIANKLGYRVVEVPVRWDNSPDSRVRVVRDSLRMLVDVIRIRMQHGRFRER